MSGPITTNNSNATERTSVTSSYPIKQDKDDPVFKDSQSKCEDISNKSISERAASVVGDITKGFFEEFFGAKFEKDIVSEEDVSSKAGGVSEGNNVSKENNASEEVVVKKVLKGMVGVVSALPFLIGMGTLYIANVVRFAATKEDIYVNELNEFLQSSDVDDKKQAISYLNDLISKYEKGTVEYNAAKSFLSKDIRPLYKCLESTDEDLKNNSKTLLYSMLKSKDQDINNIAERIVRCGLGSDNDKLRDDTKASLSKMFKSEDQYIKSAADGIIKSCFVSRNSRLKANTITLLTDMLKSTNIDMKNVAKEIINSKAFEGCIKSYDSQLKPSLVPLFTTMLKNEETKVTAEEIIKKCLESNDLKLKANTIALLADMLNDENTDEYEVAQTLLSGNKELIDKIQDGLSEMLDNEAIKGNAIKILDNAFEVAIQDKEDFFENKISHKKSFLVKNLDKLKKIEKDSSTELLLKKMFDKNETKDLAVKVLKYLNKNSLYTQELREHFHNANENSDSEVLDQEENFL